MQPVIKNYPGGKHGNGTYQAIINQIPPIEKYIEPMVGSGGVFCHLKLPACIVINDIDISVIDKYKNLNTPGLIVENLNYQSLIAKHDDGRHGTLIYFDPPYMLETRKSKAALYNHEWTSLEHTDFLNYVISLKTLVIISHYPNSLYDEFLKNWRKITYQSMTRAGLANECLYMNYPEPTQLQDYRYIGKDFTERQQIKRKIARHLHKLSQLPAKERNAIITCSIERFNYEVPNQPSIIYRKITKARLAHSARAPTQP